MIGASGRISRVGPSTDSPPTPESKKRMGASAFTVALWRGPASVASCAAVAVCYSPTPMTSEMLLAVALGYLLGSIPFGLVLTRIAGKGDVRKIGSGNIGATNVLRTGSKWLAALTLMLDCLKATAAVLLAKRLFGVENAAFAASGAMLGHLYPVWLGFRGGKGVSTLLGVLIALLPIAAALYAFVWIILLLT